MIDNFCILIRGGVYMFKDLEKKALSEKELKATVGGRIITPKNADKWNKFGTALTQISNSFETYYGGRH